MLKYDNILIAVDGSREAEWAFHKAIDIAKRNNSKLSIINVIDTRSFASVEAYDRTISQRANDFAQKLLDGYEALALDRGVEEVDKIIDYGSPKSIIPKKAVATGRKAERKKDTSSSVGMMMILTGEYGWLMNYSNGTADCTDTSFLAWSDGMKYRRLPHAEHQEAAP